MKNNRIVRAYDSINPSIADKQKMLDAILAEANLEEKPEKVRKKREPVVYTAKPTKVSRRSTIMTIAASLVMLLISGIVLMHMIRQPQDVSMTNPAETVNTGTQYDAVLNKYKKAIAEGWSKDQCEIEGISTRMESGGDFIKLGYALLDLDGDGREELLIAEEAVPHYDNLWDLYTTLEDGTPIQLWVDERDGYQGYLYEGNVIGIEYSGKTQGEYLYQTLENGQLTLLEGLQYDNDNWFYTDSEGKTNAISSDQAMVISYGYEHLKLELTWLADMPDYLRDSDAMERYLPTIEKYRTAIEEGWNRTMCNGNGMSMCTPIESEYESLFYALYDLNGDNRQELIISEYPYRENTDTSFIDIYTLYNDEVKNVMSLFDLAGMRSLCEGGLVKDRFFESGREWDNGVSFLRLEGDMFVNELAVYKKDNQWYTEGYRGVGAVITREEADEIVAQYPPLKLDFIEIESASEAEYQSGYEAFDHIIQKYVTAINKSWTEHQCEQNDISPQILSDTCIQYNLGWCLKDIDNNGVEELIVSDGVHLFDLYVMMPHDGSPGHLVMANGGESWQLCENGVIQKHGLYSGTTAWRYYTLRDIDLVQRDMVFYEGATNQYSYGTSDHDLQPIAKEKAGEIIGRDRTMELSLTKFVDPEPFVPDEQKYYEPLLDIYRQAIREDWNPGQCVENGISLMVGNYGDFVEALGYTTMDLDSNGIQELIITDGTNIYDLYTIVQNEEIGPLRLVDAMERIEYFLTEDSMIYCSGSGGAGMHVYSLSSLEGQNLRMMTGFMYAPDTDAENPWFWYDGEEQGDPCGYDAQPVIDNWKTVRIPFVSFE